MGCINFYDEHIFSLVWGYFMRVLMQSFYSSLLVIRTILSRGWFDSPRNRRNQKKWTSGEILISVWMFWWPSFSWIWTIWLHCGLTPPVTKIQSQQFCCLARYSLSAPREIDGTLSPRWFYGRSFGREEKSSRDLTQTPGKSNLYRTSAAQRPLPANPLCFSSQRQGTLAQIGWERDCQTIALRIRTQCQVPPRSLSAPSRLRCFAFWSKQRTNDHFPAGSGKSHFAAGSTKARADWFGENSRRLDSTRLGRWGRGGGFPSRGRAGHPERGERFHCHRTEIKNSEGYLSDISQNLFQSADCFTNKGSFVNNFKAFGSCIVKFKIFSTMNHKKKKHKKKQVHCEKLCKFSARMFIFLCCFGIGLISAWEGIFEGAENWKFYP